MNRTKNLIQRLKYKDQQALRHHQAARAAELNTAILQLWQDQGIHSKGDFNDQIAPMYTVLLEKLKQHQPSETAEQALIDLLNQTARACRHRWSVRLPMKRPGSDYRRYEIIYTDALVIAMAVGCLAAHDRTCSPQQLAGSVVPEAALARLQADPLVWEDWLGYFEQADRGGLYAVSICAGPPPATPKTVVRTRPLTPRPQQPPPPGSGRAMLEAIRSALTDGSLSFNQPGDAVQVDGAGRTFLEHPGILTWCSQKLALNYDMKTLKSRFSRLRVHKRSAQGHQLYYGRRGKNDRRRIGYVVENPAVLWGKEAPTGSLVIENTSNPG